MLDIGYLSFDASVKIHYSGRYSSTKTSHTGHGGITGYIRHIDRGADRRNGCEVQHSNADIDSDYTLDNESYYKDVNGNWKKTDQSKDMLHAVNARIQYAKEHGARISTKGQNDTVIARPLVVQLDGETIQGHEDTWAWDVMEVLEQQFGENNIVGFSVHKDETNIHIHAVFIPCYETKKANGKIKCTLSQTQFFKNPKQLAGMHKSIRKKLCDKGYEVEQENKPIDEQLAGYYDKQGEWHQQGLTPDQLKQLTDKELNLKMEEINMRLKKDEMDRLEKAMLDMQAAAKAKQEQIEKDRMVLESQQTAIAQDKATVQAQLETLVQEKVAVQKMKEDAEKMLENAYETADVCSKILSDEKHLNSRFLEFLDREGERTGKQTRRYVEYLYERFQKERRESLSDWELELLRMHSERRKGNTPTAPDIIDTEASTGYSVSL